MFHKILVALDNSAVSNQVCDKAIALAKAMGSGLMLLHVLSPEEGSPDMSTFNVEYYSGLGGRTLEIYHEQWDRFEEQGLELLRSRTNEAIAAGVVCEFTQLSGNPGRKICDLAHTWGADLIIVGRRGRSGLTELLLGSVSNYVLHHAPCSVLTVQYPVKTNTQFAIDQSSEVSASI